MSGYPLESERLLDAISGLAELVTPFDVSDSALVTNGSESTFVKSPAFAENEGVLLGYSFEWEAEDLQTSPVFVVLVSGSSSNKRLGPFKAAIGNMLRPFFCPPHMGLFIPRGQQVGLSVKNGEASGDYTAFGRVFGITWSESEAARVREALARGGREWPRGGLS